MAKHHKSVDEPFGANGTTFAQLWIGEAPGMSQWHPFTSRPGKSVAVVKFVILSVLRMSAMLGLPHLTFPSILHP